MSKVLVFSGAVVAILALHLQLGPSPVARAGAPSVLVPIGASYQEDTLAYFSLRALARDTDSLVTIRVLPITYASNPFGISGSERAQNLALAQTRAGEIEAACQTVVGPQATCEAQVVDIQVRNDADNPTLVDQLTGATDGLFILGGDQTIAMQVTANTLLESALAGLYNNGVPIGGTSAGAAVQSRNMIAGYTGNNFAWHALSFGAIDLWYGPPETDGRGLIFGLENAVVDQHVLERGRIPRLLQATQRLPGSHIGIGVDWGTGVRIENADLVTETVGAYLVLIVDQETYGAADTAEYFGPGQVLSIRDVGLHLLPPGGFGYDLNGRQPVFDGTAFAAPDIAGRDRVLTAAAPGAGPLYLAGDLSVTPLGPVTAEFAQAAQAAGGVTVVFAAGYPNDSAANQAANTWAGRLVQLGVADVQSVALTGAADPETIAALLSSAGAVFMVGGRQDVLANQVQTLKDSGIGQVLLDRWHDGAPVLLDNAAAAAAGSWMSAAPPPTDVEIEASDSFLAGHVPIAPGLGLLPGTIFEPRVLYDYLYGRLVSHLAAHPDLIGFGIERGTAIRIDPDGVRVLGEMAVIVFDARYAAHIDSGENGAFAAAWLLLDTFASGENIAVATEAGHKLYLPITVLQDAGSQP